MSHTAPEPDLFRTISPDGPGWRRMRDLLRNPMSMYTEAFYRERLVAMPLGGRRMVQVMVPDLAETILKDTETFGRSIYLQRLLGPALGDGLLTSEGASWRQQRRAASPAFRAKTLNVLVETFDAAGERLGDRLRTRAGETADIFADTTRATYEVIAATLLSDPQSATQSGDRFAADLTTFMETVGRFSLYEMLPFLERIAPRSLFVPHYREGRDATARLRSFAEHLVAARMQQDQSEAKDLLGMLIAAEDPDSHERLTAAQLVDNALTFIGAGHETTSVALCWTAWLIAQLPGLQDDLAAEAGAAVADGPVTPDAIDRMPLHDRVFREAMRLYPPVAMIPRSVTKDVTLDDVDLEPGDHVTIGVYPLHRRPSLWEQAETFDPDRWLPARADNHHRFQYLPFGGGPRICIGQRFAIMEGVTMLAHMVRAVRFARSPSFSPEPRQAVTLRPKGGMRLEIQKR